MLRLVLLALALACSPAWALNDALKVILFTPPAVVSGASIAFGNGLAEHFSAAAATQTTSGTVTVSAGQMYVVSVLHQHGQADSVGDGTNACTHRRTQQRNSAGNFYLSLWSCENATGGTFSITVDFAGANTSTATVLVQVLTGTAAASYLSATANSNNSDATSPITVDTGASASVGNMCMFAVSTNFNGQTYTPNDSWTTRQSSLTGTAGVASLALMSRPVTSAGTQTGSVSLGTDADQETVIACFQ